MLSNGFASVLAICLTGAQLGAQSAGQSTTPTGIGVVDIARIFEGYAMTGDLESMFDTRRRQIADQAESRRQAIDRQLQELQAFDPSTSDFQQRQKKVQTLQIEYRVWLETEEQMLKNEHMSWLRRIYDDVQAEVSRLAKQRGLDLVLTYQDLPFDLPDSLALRREIMLKKVLYFSDRVDLTQPVLGQLNSTYQQKGGLGSLQRNNAPGSATAPNSSSGS